MSDNIEVPPGQIWITTYGAITVETTQSLVLLQRRIAELGIKNLDIRFAVGTLVDKARNEAAAHMLSNPQNSYLWFIDADMTFQPQLLDTMLKTAFADCKWADIVGAYCQLRGKPYLPTIDTGTGTWEAWTAGQGPLEVIRTGAACVLIKRQVFEKLEYPWYGIRPTPRPLDMLAEVDNFARVKFDGRNPFMQLPEWEQLLTCAREDARAKPPGKSVQQYQTVGEDSSLCDKAKAAGFRIVVDTNAVCGHIDRKIIQPQDHADAMKEVRISEDAAVGIIA